MRRHIVSAPGQQKLNFLQPTLEERFADAPEEYRKPLITIESEREGILKIIKRIAYGSMGQTAAQVERAWELLAKEKEMTTEELHDEVVLMGIKVVIGRARRFTEIAFVKVHSGVKKLHKNDLNNESDGELPS